MELQKRKYKKNEVSAILKVYQRQYEENIAELKKQILDLAKRNTELLEEVERVRSRESLVYKTLERAEITSQEIEKNAKMQYALEIERLKRFSEKWDDFFKSLEEDYPHDKTAKKAVKINQKIKDSVDDNPQDFIEEIDKFISGEKTFNPKKKIVDYIAATGDNGFNLDEVLNPGKLELEDLCKELGLMQEK